MEPKTRILVAGAGAVGLVFGALLQRAGHAVTLLGRIVQIEAIRSRGLRVEGLWGEHRVTGFELACGAADLTEVFDAILVTVKAYDTGAMAEMVAPLLAPHGVMISLQNGLGNADALAQRVGAQRVLAGRVIFGVELVAPACVRVTVYAAPVLIGCWKASGIDQQAQIWADRFAAAGVPTVFCGDILAALWGKVLYNAALNPLGALLGVHYGVLAEHADTRAVMDAVIDEAFAVAVAERIALSWASAAEYRAEFYDRLVPSTYDHRSSMLQDLQRGRRTEVDAINGEVWRRGRHHGIATPVNELLTRLVHAREATRGAARA